MRYVSTRGAAPALGFEEVLLAGPARDGGLYVPESWPVFSPAQMREFAGLSYAELAARVMRPFVAGAISDDEFARLTEETYAAFRHKAVAPLVQLDSNLWLLELFQGPTLAFKDYALQLLGRLFDLVLKRRGRHVTVVGATSGDTGSAAIEACRDRDSIDVFILHPKGRVSDVQRRQMTTVAAANVHNIAVKGTFDDCQDLVKAMFADEAFRERMNLAAVNSINWARVMAQTVYYFAAAAALGAPDRALSFAVPTGNFGNVYAGYAARRMGLPIERLTVATNRNDILARFLASGELAMAEVVPTLSPAMDIQVSSNLERLLFELYGRDGKAVEKLMKRFRAEGSVTVEKPRYEAARELFEGFRLDDEGTLSSISETYRSSGVLADPHSAIGIAAARAHRDRRIPMVALATAHPAKFPEAVEKATGVKPALPPHLADLMERPERCSDLPNELKSVEEFIAGRVSRRGAA
ncbi:MAG TPA: threonine synthase [Alphaproteobacteria bacterium]|nr:threonine synthase [Alphaproteobacteria bacterium]